MSAYAKKMAAMAARPATAMELLMEPAAPWNGWMGEAEGFDAAL